MEKLAQAPSQGTVGYQCAPSRMQRRFVTTYLILLVNIVFILLSCRALHTGLRNFGQPRVISHTIVGMMIGYVQTHLVSNEGTLPKLLYTIAKFVIMSYMFVLGVEMEPKYIMRRPTPVTKIAYLGIGSTIFFGVAMQKVLSHPGLHFFVRPTLTNVVGLSLVLANTSSPILTRLITDLKIGKSEIGRIVMSAGIVSDMSSMLIMAASPIIESELGLLIIIFLALQWAFIVTVFSRFVKWVNDKNAEGQPIRTSYILLTLLIVLLLSFISTWLDYNGTLNAFLVGLAFPREGRLTRHLVHRINLLLGSVFFPLYFCWVGVEAFVTDYGLSDPTDGFGVSLAKFTVLVFIGTFGKVSGTLMATTGMGFPLPEGIAIGLLLHIKGHFPIFSAAMALGQGIINRNTYRMIVLANTFTILYIPLVVRMIVRRARRREASLQLGLQSQDPKSDLRVLVCLQGPHNVPPVIRLIEVMRGALDGGALTVYTMDMVELTGQTAATLMHVEGLEAVTVTDESIMEMRQQITIILEAYAEEAGENLTIRRLLAISPYENMHEDICNSATDALTPLIVMPFHKRLCAGSTMMDSYPEFREVNKKVLDHAACSVGILVDRGLGKLTPGSSSFDLLHVAALFFGGADDREALHLASRLAYHPSLKLTLLRFVANPSAVRLTSWTYSNIDDEDRELELDHHCLANFRARHVDCCRVSYVEKSVTNGAETVSVLREIEGQYSLFVVGRSGGDTSVLTAGMSDWEENPELGVIGDILAAEDFSQTASTLIIQQHDPAKRRSRDGWVDEFFTA